MGATIGYTIDVLCSLLNMPSVRSLRRSVVTSVLEVSGAEGAPAYATFWYRTILLEQVHSAIDEVHISSKLCNGKK